jgi:protein-disulfide isomerase
VLAVAGIVALQVLPGSGHSGPAAPGTRTSAGILVPAVATDASTAQGRSLGRGDAPVTLTVWSDFQCPSCKVFSDTIEPRLIANYVVPGKLRIVYRDLDIIGPESDAAATAARCADQQGAFWPYHDVLFANQKAENSGAITPGRLKDMADAVGLDRKAFDACLPSTDLLNQVQAETREGQTRGRATPTLDFGSRVISGSPPYDQLRVIVDGLIASAGGSPAPSDGASPAGSAGAPPASAGPSATP